MRELAELLVGLAVFVGVTCAVVGEYVTGAVCVGLLIWAAVWARRLS